MAKKKYIVALEQEERKELESITTKGKSPAYRVNHARILLKADINQEKGGLRDKEISEALDISVSTIERVRQKFVEESLESISSIASNALKGKTTIVRWRKRSLFDCNCLHRSTRRKRGMDIGIVSRQDGGVGSCRRHFP